MKEAAQAGPRLSSADVIVNEPDPKNPDGASRSNDRGLVISHLHTFEDNPIMWVHMDKKSMKIIFRNRDFYDIPYL